jgi:general secretion pathway protein K
MPAYACPNAPIEHLGELTLIKGIGPRLLYGTPDFSGIADYLTTFGLRRGDEGAFTYEGRININTAGLAVIAALLPEGSEGLAQAIYGYRNEFGDSLSQKALSNPAWYQDAPGIGDTRIDPQLITTTSDYFRVEAEASLHELKMKVTSVVHREIDPRNGNWTCRTLSWQVD